VPASGLLIGYVEILGTLRVGGILAKGPPSSLEEHIYVADVLAKTERTVEFSIDSAEFDGTDWSSVGLGTDAPPDALQKYATEAQAPLVKQKQERDAALIAAEVPNPP
jgi:hypothetical protein